MWILLFLSGNHGNTLDGQALSATGEAVDEVRRNGENPNVHPLTPPVRPVTNDRQYYHIPWEDSKPCTHIKFTWQDHRRRLYNSNVLLKICERLVSVLSVLKSIATFPALYWCKTSELNDPCLILPLSSVERFVKHCKLGYLRWIQGGLTWVTSQPPLCGKLSLVFHWFSQFHLISVNGFSNEFHIPWIVVTKLSPLSQSPRSASKYMVFTLNSLWFHSM